MLVGERLSVNWPEKCIGSSHNAVGHWFSGSYISSEIGTSMAGFFSIPVQLLSYRCSIVEVVGYKQDLSFQFRGTRELMYMQRKWSLCKIEESEGFIAKE